MRNLHVIREEVISLEFTSGLENEEIVAVAYDSEQGTCFLGSTSCTVYSRSFSGQDHWSISLLEDSNGGSPAVLKEPDKITSLLYVLEKNALVLGMAEGDIFQLDLSSREVEVVGLIDGGILNMDLSPDGDMLVVATGLGQLLLMTQDWDVVYEISLNQTLESSQEEVAAAPAAPSAAVQISWRGDGKYFTTLETQSDSPHRGLESASTSIKVWERDTGALHSTGEPIQYVQPALCWSPNGSRIACACTRLGTKEPPAVVLFERNGLKRSSFDISAPHDAKIDSLQWNANSELLAILLRCEGRDYVQVWNLNNFYWYLKQEWRYPTAKKVRMFWDPEKSSRLVCWTASGHLTRRTLAWKSAVLGCSTAFVIDGTRLLVTPLALAVIPPPMFMLRVQFKSPVQAVAARFEKGGKCLILAVLSDGSGGFVSLPEMDSWDDLEESGTSAREVTSPSDLGLDLGFLKNVSWVGSTQLVGSMSFTDDLGVESLVELDLVNEVASYDSEENRNLLTLEERWQLKLVCKVQVDQAVLAIASSASNFSEGTKTEAFVQFGDGSVVSYSPGKHALGKGQSKLNSAATFLNFGSPSPWMQAFPFRQEHPQKQQMILIGLDEQGKLFVNKHLVCGNCTSYSVHESATGGPKTPVVVVHVVFTTKADKMYVIDLEEILSGRYSGEEVIISKLSSPAITKDRDRPTTLVGKSGARAGKGLDTRAADSLKVRPLWERDARLVTTVGGKDAAVILQTTRGNLETVCPRGLVLWAIATALSGDNFEDAVFLARRHHINLNVIVDYKGWERFTQAAGTFVQQIRSLGHITEVVQALNNENIMKTTYKNLIPVYKDSAPSQSAVEANGNVKAGLQPFELGEQSAIGKVQAVLRAIRMALEAQVPDSPARELCILTTLARSGSSELEESLERVKVLREAEVKGISDGSVSSLENRLNAEAAVKHLIWLTDAEVIFRVALGLYDLHLAAIVAVHSQRDPKEFLPLLEDLGKMPNAKMRYTIDKRLGRFESALKNCAEIGEDHFGDCIQLVNAHPELFPPALEIFKASEEKRIVVLDAWGDYLVKENNFEEAGATFCACSQFSKALDAYRLGGLWESVMIMAGRMGRTSSEILQLASEVRDELQAMGRLREAAQVARDYCNDVEGAISLLLDAHEWSEVARLSYLCGKGELVKQRLEPSVLEAGSAQLKSLDESVEKVGKYLARFLAIHHRRVLLAAKLRSESQGHEKVEDDASSDVSLSSRSTHSNFSGASQLSAYTQGSSRNSSTSGSRRQSRGHKGQGGRIRAGSPGEELALVEHLKGMAPGSRALEEHRLLLQALLQLGHEAIAKRLQHAMSRFVSVQEDAVRETAKKMDEERSLESAYDRKHPIHTKSGVMPMENNTNVEPVNWQWEILR